MSGLLLVAALAAQPATTDTTPAAPVAAKDVTGKTATPGQSTYVDLEGGAGYSTNPLQQIGKSNGSGLGRVSAHAVHRRVSTRTTTVLSGYAQSVFYTKRYGSQQSFDVNGRHDAAVSEKLRLFVDGDVAYDKGGQLDTRIVGVPNVPLLPGTTVPPVLLPTSNDFLTVTGRTFRTAGHVGAQWALSEREFLNLSTGIDHVVLKSAGFETRYTTIPALIGYDRQLNERTTVGARLLGQFTHYSGSGALGARNLQLITPELTAQYSLSQRLSLSADAGVSFASVDDGVRTRHSSGFSGDVNLCSAGEHSQLCARASMQDQAATSAGPARVLGVGVDYSRQLSANGDTIQFSLSANRYSNPVVILAGPALTRATYVRAAADYSRHIGNRLFGGVELAARKLTQSGLDPDPDFSASVFIRYRLGDLQ